MFALCIRISIYLFLLMCVRGRPHITAVYNGLREGGGFRNLLYALYEGERGVCADVI